MKFKFHVKGFTVNTFYRKFNNRIVISKQGLEWKNKIIRTLRCDYKIYQCFEGRIRLNLVFNFKTKRKRDLDNLLKPLIDCFKGIIYIDDEVIDEIFCVKRIHQEEDSIELEVLQIDQKK